MVTAPKCNVCGTAHWSGQPHAFAKAPEKPAAKLATPKIVPAAPDKRDALIVELRAEIEALRPDALAWRARKAANAERMKARRAKP